MTWPKQVRSVLSQQASERWTDSTYSERQRATRRTAKFKERASASARAAMTDARRSAISEAVVRSWKDPEKRSSRLEKRSEKYRSEFGETIQASVLRLIAESRAGITTAEIKAVVPNARGAIEKLTKKNLITKRGGKFGRFFLTDKESANGC